MVTPNEPSAEQRTRRIVEELWPGLPDNYTDGDLDFITKQIKEAETAAYEKGRKSMEPDIVEKRRIAYRCAIAEAAGVAREHSVRHRDSLESGELIPCSLPAQIEALGERKSEEL